MGGRRWPGETYTSQWAHISAITYHSKTRNNLSFALQLRNTYNKLKQCITSSLQVSTPTMFPPLYHSSYFAPPSPTAMSQIYQWLLFCEFLQNQVFPWFRHYVSAHSRSIYAERDFSRCVNLVNSAQRRYLCFLR